jgi:hypothetical protein
MSGSATFTTRSEPGTLSTFASLRFKGDRLEPSRVTAILGTAPTLAYRKGEIFKRSRGHEVRGRTGVWLLSTKGHVPDPELGRHLRYLLAVVFSGNSEEKITRLRNLMREEQIEADVNCFWYGKSGAQFPVIPEEIRTAFARLPAEIETDFDTD